jgi:hypothetical protein
MVVQRPDHLGQLAECHRLRQSARWRRITAALADGAPAAYLYPLSLSPRAKYGKATSRG